MGKGSRVSSATGGFEAWIDLRQNVMPHALPLHHCYHKQSSVWPNQTSVGGVSVNSICQQGGLFGPGVNRHSE